MIGQLKTRKGAKGGQRVGAGCVQMMRLSGATFGARTFVAAIRGLKPPANIRRPFGPERRFGHRSSIYQPSGLGRQDARVLGK